jgi:hypothetical protein
MTQDESLLLAVEIWHGKNWAELAAEGVFMDLSPRSTNRSKNSASIDFNAPSRLASAVFWDSGESEISTASYSDQEEPKVRIHHIGSANEVEALLDQFLIELRAPSSVRRMALGKE